MQIYHICRWIGLAGSCLWEETLNDLVVETCIDWFNEIVRRIYMWKLFKREPAPENPEKIIEEVKVKMVKGVKYIQSVAEKQGKKFIVGDKVLCSVWSALCVWSILCTLCMPVYFVYGWTLCALYAYVIWVWSVLGVLCILEYFVYGLYFV